MLHKKLIQLVSIMAVLILALTGCASQTATEAPVAVQDTSSEEVSDTIVIEHAMGTTEITGRPQRVVTLYQGATDVALALDVKPVGVVESWVQKPMYEYLREELSDTPIVGLETQPNLEEIAKLQPDLIIASKIRHEKIYDQLSAIAPTVSHETVFKFKETTELMGKALGKEEEASALVEKWEERVSHFKNEAQAKLGDQWPVEYAVLNFRTDHSRIYVSGYAADILSELGFNQPADHKKAAEEGQVVMKLTTMESIPAMNAQTFFIFAADGHNPDAEAIQQTYDKWTGHPLWKNLDAVKNQRIYTVDDVAWNMAGGYMSANMMLDQVYEAFNIEQ